MHKQRKGLQIIDLYSQKPKVDDFKLFKPNVDDFAMIA